MEEESSKSKEKGKKEIVEQEGNPLKLSGGKGTTISKGTSKNTTSGHSTTNGGESTSNSLSKSGTTTINGKKDKEKKKKKKDRKEKRRGWGSLRGSKSEEFKWAQKFMIMSARGENSSNSNGVGGSGGIPTSVPLDNENQRATSEDHVVENRSITREGEGERSGRPRSLSSGSEPTSNYPPLLPLKAKKEKKKGEGKKKRSKDKEKEKEDNTNMGVRRKAGTTLGAGGSLRERGGWIGGEGRGRMLASDGVALPRTRSEGLQPKDKNTGDAEEELLSMREYFSRYVF